jgi:hypothetical protein
MNFLDFLRGKQRDAKSGKLQSANEFVNVRDVRGSVLYTKDEQILAFLKIQPLALDLLSPREKEKKIRTFSAEFSSEKKPFKLFSISRPVDISGLSSRLTRLLAKASDAAQKDLLHHEIREISALSLTGEVIERQFYLLLWEHANDEGESALLRRARELENRFASCEIVAELCGQETIIRLLNLFANPNYAHVEDGDSTPTIPILSTLGGQNDE